MWVSAVAATSPGLTLAGTALFGLLLVAASRGRARESVFGLTVIGLFASLFVLFRHWNDPKEGLFGGTPMLLLDNFALFFHFTLVVGAIFALGLSWEYLQAERLNDRVGEYCVLLLLASIGAMFLVSATDLIVIFLGIDTLSLALYILTGYASERPYPTEAALKYLLLGAMASGFLIYGIAFIYGATGTTNLLALKGVPTTLSLSIGLGLLLIGLGFKIALVPFHQWAPDVYDGALTPVTSFMTTAPKVLSIAALFRVMTIGFHDPNLRPFWMSILWLLSASTILVGNLAALTQDNVKRMLAYSSVAHAGYMVFSVLALSEAGAAALAFYGLAYTLLTVGAFGVTEVVEKQGGIPATFEELKGLAHRHPLLGLAMVIFMAGLTGIPFTVGFWAKLAVFKAALEKGYLVLVILGVLGSVISAFYYLRVALVMIAHPPTEKTRPVRPWVLAMGVIGICAFLSLYLGFIPLPLWRVSEMAIVASTPH